MLTVLFAVIGIVLVLGGLAGVILPLVPGGVPVAWLGLFIFAIGTGFQRVSIAVVVIFFVVMLLTVAYDYLAQILMAKKYKASKWGTLGATFGSIPGVLIFGFWGSYLGPFLGAVLGELISGKGQVQALKIGLGTLVVLIAGTIFKVVVVLFILGFLIASWF